VPDCLAFPVGAGVTIDELAGDLHPVLRRLRETEPVSWLPALGGWLVTSAGLADKVLRGPRAFTVEDPRFTTAQVVGPSMLSLDGAEHSRHRDPFAKGMRAASTAQLTKSVRSHAARLVTALTDASGAAELRRGLAGQLAVAVMADLLGLGASPAQMLAWYDAIVAGVSALSDAGGADIETMRSAAAAFGDLDGHMRATLTTGNEPTLIAAAAGSLAPAEIVSNYAVMLFGGIETTEGLISNAIWYLLGDEVALTQVAADRTLLDGAVEEALRLEPAAAVVDRYATADVTLGGAAIRRGDLVTVSLAGANRDPEVFADPDRFDIHRSNARQHLAFAAGPHFCVGAQLARLEAGAAVGALLDQLPGLRLDPARPTSPRGLVFRKPPTLHVLWDPPALTGG
jgi:cytochrome P450